MISPTRARGPDVIMTTRSDKNTGRGQIFADELAGRLQDEAAVNAGDH
jgi:hypothetical protein